MIAEIYATRESIDRRKGIAVSEPKRIVAPLAGGTE
jgi:hypothetical protein